jgi:hypothetical protein
VTRLKWKLDSVCLEIDVRLAPNVPQVQKSFWMHLLELLDDVDHVESRFGPFGDSVCVGAR